MRALVLALPVLLASCSRAEPAAPARFHHFVFIGLADPSQADALVKECEERLPRIPGVVAMACGRPVDLGRPEVTADFDVGLHLGFDTRAHLEGYPGHAEHVALLATWRPRVKSLRIHDVEDRTP